MSQFAVRSPVTRSRTGCWTCRARRKKCDESRPYCRACRSLGLPCEGYGVRLKWAIRGRPCVTFRHASLRRKPSEPVGCRTTGMEWPGIVKEETECEQDQVLLQYLGWDIYSSLSRFERNVLYDFADWGALTLFSRPATDSVPDPGRFHESLSYCAQSKLMLLNSLTYQITFDPKHARHVNEYYGRSIRAFRQALSDPDCFQEEMTPYAGILLCSISMNRAMPFTIHLNGIASIFHERQLAVVTDTASEDSRELAGLIGVLDLPTHCLGRQNERLHMWKKHCMGQKGVEEVTGLPCSLIDLLACATDPGIEDRLLQWPGELGEPVMCKIWTATQYAGLIMARELQSNQGSPSSPCVQSTESIVQHVLLLMRDLRLRMNVDTFAATEAHLFPLVAAGSQSKALSLDDRVFIRECIVALSDSSLNNYPYYKAAMLALETYWASDGVNSLDVVTRDLGLELGLF